MTPCPPDHCPLAVPHPPICFRCEPRIPKLRFQSLVDESSALWTSGSTPSGLSQGWCLHPSSPHWCPLPRDLYLPGRRASESTIPERRGNERQNKLLAKTTLCWGEGTPVRCYSGAAPVDSTPKHQHVIIITRGFKYWFRQTIQS